MRFGTKLSERELDGILAGKASGGELDDVATFFREMRIGLDEAPPPSVEARHLAGIFEEARHLQPSATERPIPAPRGTRRLRNQFRRLATRTTIAAVGLAALAAFGGAAYAGALPAPLQGKVADLARNIGLSLPGNHDHSKQRGGRSDGGVQHTGNTDQPAQGNPGQGTGTGTQDNGPGNGSHGDETQGNSTQTNGGQDNGDQGAQTNGNQGAQTTTVQGAQSKQGTQGAQNEHSTPSGGSGADQQGNGAGNSAGNGD